MCPKLYLQNGDRLDGRLAMAWSHRMLMAGSEVRDDRFWICNIESSKSCEIRKWNGTGAEGVKEMPKM